MTVDQENETIDAENETIEKENEEIDAENAEIEEENEAIVSRMRIADVAILGELIESGALGALVVTYLRDMCIRIMKDIGDRKHIPGDVLDALHQALADTDSDGRSTEEVAELIAQAIDLLSSE